MGWWSHHPMGGDRPLDIKDSFLGEYREKLEKDCPEGEDSFEYAEKHLHDLLCKMTLDELNRLMKNPWVKGLGGDGEYAYVIPFVFVEYECFDKYKYFDQYKRQYKYECQYQRSADVQPG